MTEYLVPAVAALDFTVNNRHMGLIKSCSIRTVCDTKNIRAIGENENVAVVRGGQHYVITIRCLLPDYADFVEDLQALQEFSFSVSKEGSGYCFLGCQLLSHVWHSDGSSGYLEEAEFYAQQRVIMSPEVIEK